MELSINEKAASFIGFVPETCDIELDCPQRVCYRCKRTHRTAPDMQKPENYMRALEAYVEKYPYGLIDFRGGWGTPKFCVFLGMKWGTKRSVAGSGETIGAAMIEALAALHDAEAGDAR